MLSRRYPRYDAEVQDFLLKDPLRTPRLALAIAWAGFGARDGLPVYLAHSLGGGANMALEREIARDLRTCGAAVVLRVGGASISRRTASAHRASRRGDRHRGRASGNAGRGAALADRLFLRRRRSSRSANCPACFCGFGATCCAIGSRRGCMTSSRSRPPIACWAPMGAIAARSVARARTLPISYTSAEGRSIDLSGVAARLACPAVGLRRDHRLRPSSAEVFGAAYPTCRTACCLRAATACPLPERVIPDSGDRRLVCWETSTRRKARA
jgi:hypothetical protein